MSKKQRSPHVKFDDIPGELPQGSVPPDANLTEIANLALSKLNNPQLDDLAIHTSWRDLLSFTGTFRTFESRDRVYDTLQKLSRDKQRSVFRLNNGGPRVEKSGPNGWIDVDILFSTVHEDLVGQCAGTVSITQFPDSTWKIWMLRTWLENFDGHGHPDELEPGEVVNGHTNGLSNGHSNGHSNGDSDDAELFDVVIVGGGQAGLSVAGRSKALGIKALVLERNASIGDVWANRYESLKWHTSKESGNLPFGHTFPDEEYMVPTKRIAAGHKAWSEKYGLNIRTKTSVDAARWDDATQTWTVETSSPIGKSTLKSRDLVLAIGPGHQTPSSPEWATPEKIAMSDYQGTIMHSTSYRSCQPWAGKRGIVIGTANTAHDVAEDMANAGMETTMVQRNATFIFPVEWLHVATDKHYKPDESIAHADRVTYTYPNKIMREIINRGVHTGVKNSSKRFDDLEAAGFKVERYGDIYNNLYVRFGGHYVDIGASARISKGEIKMKGQPVKGLTKTGLLFDDGSKVDADLIVLCTGFDHDFRSDASRILGPEIADQMDDFFGLDAEGELRGHAKFAGHPHLYYFGGDTRIARFFSSFVALQLQANALGKPMEIYSS